MQVNFQVGKYSFVGEMNTTLTAQEIIRHLPLTAPLVRWGDELYFETGILASDHNATMEVAIGDLAYWPEGKCVCLFFGRTPVSQDDKPRPASPVVIIGRTNASPLELKKLQSGETVRVNAEKPPEPAKPSAQGDRKLSQAEIDVLVQKLLAERAAKEQKKQEGSA